MFNHYPKVQINLLVYWNGEWAIILPQPKNNRVLSHHIISYPLLSYQLSSYPLTVKIKNFQFSVNQFSVQ